MDNFFKKDFVSRQLKTTSVEELWEISLQAFTELGITHLIYVYCRGYLNTTSDTTLLTNLPDWWTKKYIENDYAAYDPFFIYCCQTYEPVRTGLQYIDDYEYLNPKEKDLITEASETGFRSGTTCIIRRRGLGPDFGGWNFGTSLNRNQFEALYKKHANLMRLIALFTHERLSILNNNNGLEKSLSQMPKLTERQLDCLTLLSRGHRTRDIAKTLKIKPITVEYHLNLAKDFLNATTREQAIAIAVIKGLIEVA